jgi:hypothetical protein
VTEEKRCHAFQSTPPGARPRIGGSAENLARLIPEVEEMMGTGMIATSDVE